MNIETVQSNILVYIDDSTRCLRRQNIDGAINCLEKAVALYEKYPTAAHRQDSEMSALLDQIRTVQSLCESVGEFEIEVLELEGRAETLRSPLH